jgi:hypothetical protein
MYLGNVPPGNHEMHVRRLCNTVHALRALDGTGFVETEDRCLLASPFPLAKINSLG